MSTKKTPKPHRSKARDRTRQIEFARAYLAVGQRTYLNAERSAIAAGYSKKNAHANSYKLLDKIGVMEEMRRLREQRAARSTICTPEEVLEILSAQARTTPECFVDGQGAVIPLKAGEKNRAHAVASIEETTRTIAKGDDVVVERKFKYKLVDRTKALEILAKHHGLFEKDNEQSKPDPMPLQLVCMPSGPLTLAEWTAQVQELKAKEIEE